ncbi:MAG: type II toxin-antitoxin system RelE/ParE family toxin [Candidatus Woesearchaeota archaeon]
MYNLERSDKLIRILKKLYKKNKQRYEATLNKISEVTNSGNPDHYKNLSYDMKQFKRAHIDSHFVLIFKVDKNNNIIRFEDLQHHDMIYRRKK